MLLKQFNSIFVVFELSPGIYTIKDFSEAVYTMADHEGTLKIKRDDISMKTKLVSFGFGGTFGTLRFDEKSFFIILLGFLQFWVYQFTNAIQVDSPGVYTTDKILNLSTLDTIHLKCDVIDGSVVNGFRQPIRFSFFQISQVVIKCFASLTQISQKIIQNLFSILQRFIQKMIITKKLILIKKR